MFRLITLAMLVAVSQQALASTPANWAKLEWRAEQSCLAASEYRRPSASSVVLFDDRVGVVAMLISGTYRPPHMKAARGTSLCLYNRKLQTAVTEEVSGWGEASPTKQRWH